MQKRYGEITKQILLVVGIAGVVVLATAAPGAVLVAKLLPQEKLEGWEKPKKKKSIERSIDGLQKNKLIVIKETGKGVEVKLTKKGREVFKKIQLDKINITKPPHWDGKWRIVIFDIPDRSFKAARDALRHKLKQWEFCQLQKSVWVCPWPCEEELQLVAELYEVTSYVNIIVAEKIFADTFLKGHFGL
jgi:DNA-binding transcriptional regulator PaaX